MLNDKASYNSSSMLEYIEGSKQKIRKDASNGMDTFALLTYHLLKLKRNAYDFSISKDPQEIISYHNNLGSLRIVLSMCYTFSEYYEKAMFTIGGSYQNPVD